MSNSSRDIFSPEHGATAAAPALAVANQFESEVRAGDRFEFGDNWRRFLDRVGEPAIAEAEASLKAMLGVDSLEGRRFLDAGSGSGLFTLAARRLGADVVSFDFDPQSVACTATLRERYFADDPDWTVMRGSVLDETFLARLGRFDVVYSWGVLHHTGRMWEALGNVAPLVAPNGRLFVSIYNDQGIISRAWTVVKRSYNGLPKPLRPLVLGPSFLAIWVPKFGRDALHGDPLLQWREHGKNRGMSPWTDVVDWVGGYPFQVAKPEQIFDFFRDRGFNLTRLKTHGRGHGCNEFVFERSAG
jgi:2-polyprenyl-3-methyl-5-hydroxy-6-metoxy-1,4-benzoquinol methylase